MNIANLGAFGAGLVRGDITAREQRRLEEDQAFQNEQRKAWRDEQARLQGERDRVAGVLAPGAYPEIAPSDDGMGPSRPAMQVTDADYARGLARAYGPTNPDKAIAAIGTANQFDERQYMLHQRKVTDAGLRAMQLIDSGDHIGGMRHLRDVYKTVNDGKEIVEVAGPNGVPLFGLAQAGRYIQQPQVVTPDAARQAVWAALKFATPEMFKTVSGLETQKISADAAMRSAGAAEKNAEATEGYRKWMETRPLVHTDGQGRIVVLNSEGTKQLGTYGNARPDPNAGMNAIRDPQAYQQAVTEYNNLAAQYLNETDPTKRSAIAKSLNVAEVKVANAMGKPTQLKLGNDPKDTNFMRDPGGSFFSNAQGMPTARMDERGEFPMIPFGIDPRVGKDWKDISGKLGDAGASLAVVQNQAGNLQWGYKSKDGRMWSTWQEATKPPELNQTPSGASTGGTATREPAQPQVSGDKAQKVGLDRSASNPYVDTKGRPTNVRVPGDDRNLMTSTVVPAVKDAARSVSTALTNGGNRYLQQKIDSGQKLTPMEEAQARRAGLLK